MDSLSDDEEVRSSLFPVNETAHSLSPIFGLALVALILIHLRIAKGMRNTWGSKTGRTFLSLFGARETSAVAFLFRQAT